MSIVATVNKVYVLALKPQYKNVVAVLILETRTCIAGKGRCKYIHRGWLILSWKRSHENRSKEDYRCRCCVFSFFLVFYNHDMLLVTLCLCLNVNNAYIFSSGVIAHCNEKTSKNKNRPTRFCKFGISVRGSSRWLVFEILGRHAVIPGVYFVLKPGFWLSMLNRKSNVNVGG